MPHYTPKFHIGDPGPQDLYEYLDTIEARSPTSIDELQAAAEDLAHQIATYEKITSGSVLGRLGVVQPEDQFTLTELGDGLVDIMYPDRELFNNLLHSLYYTAFERCPEEYIFSSYTYREFTDYLYNNSTIDSVRGMKGTIVGEVTEMAETDEQLDLSQTQRGVSLSTKSFNNYLQYLKPLEPSVNPNPPEESMGFQPRGFCPPGLFLVVVDHEYRRNDVEYETLLRVTDEIEHRIKQLCLVSDDGLNKVIEYAEQSYAFFSTQQSYGLTLRLDQEVAFHDLR
jgi:hypothetical protein